MRLIFAVVIFGVFNLTTAAASEYPPDPFALSKDMHELSITDFSESSREMVAGHNWRLGRAADKEFWAAVQKARISGYGLR